MTLTKTFFICRTCIAMLRTFLWYQLTTLRWASEPVFDFGRASCTNHIRPEEALDYDKLIIHLTHTNVWESMGKPCSCMQFIYKKPSFLLQVSENVYQYCKSCKNPYQVLQVTCIRFNVQWGLYDKIIITISTKLYQKKYHSFVAVGIVTLVTLHTHNNTDGNKLMIFSGIALYYGDTYIILRFCVKLMMLIP